LPFQNVQSMQKTPTNRQSKRTPGCVESVQYGIMQCCVCTWHTGGAAEFMACIKTSLLNDVSEAMCEQKSRAGAAKWANLVSPRCVTAVLPAKHDELLVTVSHARLHCLHHPCRWFQALTDPRAMMKVLAFSRQAPGERCGAHHTFM